MAAFVSPRRRERNGEVRTLAIVKKRDLRKADEAVREFILTGSTTVDPENLSGQITKEFLRNYAILEGGAVTLKRLRYDVDKTIRALSESPISQESKDGLSRVLRGEWKARVYPCMRTILRTKSRRTIRRTYE